MYEDDWLEAAYEDRNGGEVDPVEGYSEIGECDGCGGEYDIGSRFDHCHECGCCFMCCDCHHEDES